MQQPGSDPTRPEIVRSPVTAAAIGVLAGSGSAMLGIGGGLLMVPLLVLMLNLTQHRAVGTSLAVILPTAVAASLRYHTESLAQGRPGLDLRVIALLALGGVFGALIGAAVANRLAGRQLRRIFGLFVAATGFVMVLRHGDQALGGGVADGGALVSAMLGIGVLVGVISGLLGVGGGLVMVPALSLLLSYDQHLAQGTSLAVIIPVSISGSIAHARRGNVVWTLAPWLAVGAVTGAWLVAGLVFAVPRETLRIVFGAFLILVGVGMMTTRSPKPPASTHPETQEPQ